MTKLYGQLRMTIVKCLVKDREYPKVDNNNSTKSHGNVHKYN